MAYAGHETTCAGLRAPPYGKGSAMHSSEIASISFDTTRLHEGYAIAEVDAFVESVRKAMKKWESGVTGELVAADVMLARFTPIKFFKAYNEIQVDDFLDDVAVTFAAYEAGHHSTTA